MYKVIVQETKTRDENTPDEKTYWETVHEMTSHDQVVIASTLRAIANQYDPPRPAMRSQVKINE